MHEKNIRELSRSTTVVAFYRDNTRSNTYPDLYNAVIAGCLQRIADSLEVIQRPMDELNNRIANLELARSGDTNLINTLLKQRDDIQKELKVLKAKIRKPTIGSDTVVPKRGRPRKDGK